MRHHLLLFDIDGTLLRTSGQGVEAMHVVAKRLFGPTFNFDAVTFSGNLDPVIFEQAATACQLENWPDHHDRFRDAYLDELRQRLAEVAGCAQAMPGVPELLALLRQRNGAGGDVILGLLTGNYTQAVQIKLEAVDICHDWFTVTAFGDEAPTRPDMVALALDRYQQAHQHKPDPRKVIVIGDTPRDVDCAKVHGCVAFAVATGRYSVEQLRAAGADVAVPDLTDPGPLLALIE